MPASFATSSAIEKPIFTKTYAELALAGAAIFLADALGLRHLALQADVGLGGSGAGTHRSTLSPASRSRKCPR